MKNDGSGESIATKSQFKTPTHFFPAVVDNFFEDPEAIVEFGKSLYKEIMGAQPGKRTKNLWEIDKNLHNAILGKILSCYYDLDYVSLNWQNSNMSFHEIPRYSPDKKDIINKGWIHQDAAILGDDQIAGLIYLTPDIDPDSGTSLWSLNPNVKIKIQDDPFDYGAEGWYSKDGSFNNGDEYRKLYLEQQKSFVEKLRFQNIFNRMITYDTMEWHSANSYYHQDEKDHRLTLAFFIGGIESDSEFPLKRANNENEIIKDRIYSNVR
jgi:hypothetical protein